MPEQIPRRVDHYRYTDKAVVLEGEIPQTDLKRFSEVVTDNSGQVKYRLEFGVDALHNRFMRGRISTQAVLQCQRCLNDYSVDIDTAVSLAFVHSDFEAKKAEECGFEPYILDEKKLLDPRLLIEDELMLALPQIPAHPLNDKMENPECKVQLNYPADKKTSELDYDAEQTFEDNPFAILKKLKH